MKAELNNYWFRYQTGIVPNHKKLAKQAYYAGARDLFMLLESLTDAAPSPAVGEQCLFELHSEIKDTIKRLAEQGNGVD